MQKTSFFRSFFSVSNCLALAATVLFASNAMAVQQVRVDITSNAPVGGVALTPVWVGFHDGSFDSYNGGQSSQIGLERLAEDGNTTPISNDFLGGYTYIDSSNTSNRVLSSQAGSERVDGTIASTTGAPPIQPGETATAFFNIDTSGINRYFSYASMILPSNDYYVANGNPFAHDLSSLYDGEGSISFVIGAAGTVNDAGTEVNDFTTAAPGGPNLPGLFPGIGLPNGQSGPDTGADENGVNANVANAFGNFLNAGGVDTSLLDFNNTAAGFYTNGIATITITAVPEPSTLMLGAMSLVGLCVRRARRR